VLTLRGLARYFTSSPLEAPRNALEEKKSLKVWDDLPSDQV